MSIDAVRCEPVLAKSERLRVDRSRPAGWARLERRSKRPGCRPAAIGCRTVANDAQASPIRRSALSDRAMPPRRDWAQLSRTQSSGVRICDRPIRTSRIAGLAQARAYSTDTYASCLEVPCRSARATSACRSRRYGVRTLLQHMPNANHQFPNRAGEHANAACRISNVAASTRPTNESLDLSLQWIVASGVTIALSSNHSPSSGFDNGFQTRPTPHDAPHRRCVPRRTRGETA